MNKIVLLLSLFVLPSAFAHVEPGVYVGKTPEGDGCHMTAIRQYYKDEFAHPLNERVIIQVEDVEMALGHPPVVNVEKNIAHFNHDVFQGVIATKTGAKALVVEMDHTEGKEGPRAFTLIEHKWKTDTRLRLECRGLKFRK